MDYTSFAPGASNNFKTPVALPELPPEKEKKHLSKFVSLMVLIILIGGSASGYVWYAQSVQQIGDEIVPVFTPRADATAGWKTYTNTGLGFSIQYPLNLTPTLELNDQYNRLTSFGTSKTNTTLEVRLQKDTDLSMGIKYGFLGSEITSTTIKLGGVTGSQAISTTGYCDGPGCGKPYIVFAARHNGNVYHLIFYGDAVVSVEENQILSTFKFTPSNSGQTVCTQEAKLCPDGSAVGRTGPNCEFAACP